MKEKEFKDSFYAKTTIKREKSAVFMFQNINTAQFKKHIRI
ncbi:hypothetical protein [Phocaeicola sp.]|nr:hypothetical protein [Phocaeicola sp.]